jgi:MFS transporter, putative metabolite:H+ symporter
MRLFAKGQLGRTILLIVVWIFQTIGAYGFIAWVPTLLVEHDFSIVKSLTFTSTIAICNPLGAFIASRLVERIDRKWFITIDAIAIAVSGLLYGFTYEPVFIMIFGALVVLGIRAFIAAAYVYTPELFPTGMRSSGHGLAYGVGRLANVGGPYIIASLYSAMGYQSVFIYIGACWLIMSVAISVFGPLTSARSVETLNES